MFRHNTGRTPEFIGRLVPPMPPRPAPSPFKILGDIEALAQLAGLDRNQTPENQPPYVNLIVPADARGAAELAVELKFRRMMTGTPASMLEAGILLQLAGVECIDEAAENNAANLVSLLVGL